MSHNKLWYIIDHFYKRKEKSCCHKITQVHLNSMFVMIQPIPILQQFLQFISTMISVTKLIDKNSMTQQFVTFVILKIFICLLHDYVILFLFDLPHKCFQVSGGSYFLYLISTFPIIKLHMWNLMKQNKSYRKYFEVKYLLIKLSAFI